MSGTPIDRHDDFLVWLLAAGTFVVGTDVFVIAGMLAQIAHSLAVSLSAAGQLITVFSVAYFVLGPVLSALAGRWPLGVRLGGALLAIALGNAACAASASLPLAMTGRVLVAAGACVFSPQAATLAAELAGQGRQGRALARVSGGMVAGTVVGVPAGTWAAEDLGWRFVLALLALATVAVAGGLALGLRDVAAQAPAPGFRDRLIALRTPGVGLVLLITVLAVTAEYSVLTYVGAAFDAAVGHSSTLLAVLLFVFGVGGLVGNAVAGALLDRAFGRHLVALSIAGMTAAFLLMPWVAASFPGALGCVALWGAAGWIYAAPQQHRLLGLAQSAGSLAVSMNSSAIYAGAALGGALGGIVLNQTSTQLLTLPAAALCIAAMAAETRYRHVTAKRNARKLGEEPAGA